MSLNANNGIRQQPVEQDNKWGVAALFIMLFTLSTYLLIAANVGFGLLAFAGALLVFSIILFLAFGIIQW